MSENHIRQETERVRADWSRRGQHWNRQADAIEENARRLNRPLIEVADIRPGQKVLDLATGAGEPGLTVAEMVGEAGHVFATDLVPEMLEGARRRAQARGIANITFREADMCALPDADQSFDRAICRFGLMFVPEPARACAEVARVLKPGGRAAFMVWGPREDTTMFTVFKEVAQAMWGADDPLVDFDRMCRLGAEGSLAAALAGGGLVDVTEEGIHFSPALPAEPEPWQAQIDMSFGPKLDTVDGAERARLEDGLREAFSRYLVDGRYHFTAHVRLGTGHRQA